MKAFYRGELVKVIRIEAHRASVVWRSLVKRVNKVDLEIVTDTALISALALSIGALVWLVAR